jgi:chitin disaccharide deacetylase
MTRILIVNADDFGRSRGINHGIARAHEDGIVTSASLMVRYPAAGDAAAYAEDHPELGVGLHVDLGEWVYRDGRWPAVYELEPTAGEIECQLAEFRRLLRRDPSHVDSHQHVHSDGAARTVCSELAARLGVPLRHFSAVRHLGDFYGQRLDGTPLPENISVQKLVALIRGLPEGTTELGCHPGEVEELDSPYRHERQIEVETLCDSRVRAAIEEEGVELRSFASASL